MPVFCGLLSAGLVLLGFVWGIALLVALPRGLGNWLLPQLWRPAYPLVWPTTLYFTGWCASVGAGTWLHALAAARRSLRAAVVNSVLLLVLSLVGAAVMGTRGSIYGAAIGTWLGALYCWWQVRGAVREYGHGPAGDGIQPGKPGQGTEPEVSAQAGTG